jgi:hypothetical protein
MADQDAFGESQITDQQVDITAPLKVREQILLIAQDDVVR